jgi:phage terminase small subunit
VECVKGFMQRRVVVAVGEEQITENIVRVVKGRDKIVVRVVEGRKEAVRVSLFELTKQ